MKFEQLLRVLMGAFLVQGLLAILTWWPSSDGGGASRDLVEVGASDLAKIEIHDSLQRTEEPAEPLVLEKSGNTWTVPSKFGVPVLESKLDRLFEQLDTLEVRRPIAENAYRHVDLDVAEDQHTRKLVLTDNSGETTTLYLGSAQGNATHVRVDGETDVYLVRGITGYGISANPTTYFDTNVLKVDEETVLELNVQRTDGSAFTFRRGGGGWNVDLPPPPGRSLDQAKAAEFVEQTLTVRMREPVGTEVTPDMGFDAPTVVTWTSSEEGTTVTSRLEVGNEIGEASGRFYVRVEGQPFVYDVMKAQLENAIDKPLTSLFIAEATEE